MFVEYLRQFYYRCVRGSFSDREFFEYLLLGAGACLLGLLFAFRGRIVISGIIVILVILLLGLVFYDDLLVFTHRMLDLL